MRITVIEKKNGEQIGKYIYHPTNFCSYILDEFKECVIEVGNKGTLTYYGEDKAIIRVHKNGGGRVKLRKYLMILEHAKNGWASDLTLILTDDKERYENELKKFKEVA